MTEFHHQTPYREIVTRPGDPVEDFDLAALEGGGFGPKTPEDLDRALDGQSEMSDDSRVVVQAETDKLRGETQSTDPSPEVIDALAHSALMEIPDSE